MMVPTPYYVLCCLYPWAGWQLVAWCCDAGFSMSNEIVACIFSYHAKVKNHRTGGLLLLHADAEINGSVLLSSEW